MEDNKNFEEEEEKKFAQEEQKKLLKDGAFFFIYLPLIVIPPYLLFSNVDVGFIFSVPTVPALFLVLVCWLTHLFFKIETINKIYISLSFLIFIFYIGMIVEELIVGSRIPLIAFIWPFLLNLGLVFCIWGIYLRRKAIQRNERNRMLKIAIYFQWFTTIMLIGLFALMSGLVSKLLN